MLKRFKPKSEFTRNVLTLMTGSTIAQAIPIAISPIMTRIYTPEDYGILALYMSVFSFFATASTGKYELAIMLPKKDSDAFNILVLSIIISFFISMFSFLIIFIFNKQITDSLGNSTISNWLYLIPISVFLTGIYQSLNYWHNRGKQFHELAKTKVIQTATGSMFNLGFGFIGFGSTGLIISSFINQLVGNIFLGKHIIKYSLKYFRSVSKVKIFFMIIKYKKLPLITLPNSLIDSFRLSVISILIAKFFTTEILGQFSLAWRMIQLPMSLIGSSISQVFFQKLSASNHSDFYRIIIQFIVKASLIAGPVFIFLYFFSSNIFQFVFGEKWKIAGDAASTMSLWLFLNFITSPLSTIYIILNKQEIMFFFSIVYMIVPLSIIYFFHDQYFIQMLFLVTSCMSFLLLLLVFMTLYITYKIRNS